MKPTYEAVQAFKKDLIDVCKQHRLLPFFETITYDAYDNDRWRAVPLDEVGLFKLESMR